MYQINTTNRSRVRTTQLPEPIDVSNSIYKIRLTPASARQTPAFKNRESIFITNNSQLHLKNYPPTCSICKSDIGKFYSFCQCQNIHYHDKCFLDNVRSRAHQIHEGAFSCGFGCNQEYRIKCFFDQRRNITFYGYLLAISLLLIVMIFTLIFVLLICYWDQWMQIPVIIVLLLLLIMILTLVKNVKLHYYKISWTIKPIDEGYFKETDFRIILPYVLHNRDVLYYNSEIETIGDK